MELTDKGLQASKDLGAFMKASYDADAARLKKLDEDTAAFNALKSPAPPKEPAQVILVNPKQESKPSEMLGALAKERAKALKESDEMSVKTYARIRLLNGEI